MTEKKTNKKAQRASKRSKGERASSMKTSGLGGFIPSMKHVKPGWSAEERKSLFNYVFNYMRKHDEQGSAT